jgi:hypothetical protein
MQHGRTHLRVRQLAATSCIAQVAIAFERILAVNAAMAARSQGSFQWSRARSRLLDHATVGARTGDADKMQFDPLSWAPRR